MKICKPQLLFLVDRPEQHNELIESLHLLKDVDALRIRNMDFGHVRDFVNNRGNCVLLLFIEDQKGGAMKLLYRMYNSSFNIPYVIAIFKTGRQRFLEHVSACGVSKIFCSKYENYSDFKVVGWIKRVCRYVGMNSVFPYFNSYAESYVRYKISEKLRNMGMACYLTGYKYVVDAIELYMKNLDFCITSDIYRILSLRYYTASANIDRCMRHAIEVTWRDNSFSCLEKHYPNVSKVYENRPSVLEFVKCIANEIRDDMVF